jgi:hypothetical protein
MLMAIKQRFKTIATGGAIVLTASVVLGAASFGFVHMLNKYPLVELEQKAFTASVGESIYPSCPKMTLRIDKIDSNGVTVRRLQDDMSVNLPYGDTMLISGKNVNVLGKTVLENLLVKRDVERKLPSEPLRARFVLFEQMLQ